MTLYDLEITDYFVSRDVQFYENEFPFAQTNVLTSSPSHIVAPNFNNLDADFLYKFVGNIGGSNGVYIHSPSNPCDASTCEISLEQS